MVDKGASVNLNQPGSNANFELIQLWKDIGSGYHAPIFGIGGSGVESTQNSTNDNLAAGGVYNGESEYVLHYGEITISVIADVISAANGIECLFSFDNVDWHVTDEFEINSEDLDTVKTWKIQRVLPYFKIRYTNGASPTTHFHLTVMYSGVASVQFSHRLDSDLSGVDDAGLIKAILAADSGDGKSFQNISVQNPLPISPYRVFKPDIDRDTSTSTNWTGGTVVTLFDGSGVLVNSTSENPKTILIDLKKAIRTSILGIGTVAGTSFSNTKITAILGFGADAISTVLIDESGDNTDKTLLVPDIAPVEFNQLLIEFHTADTCALAYVVIVKAISTISRIQGSKPDGTIADFQATTAGNFKVSLEEYETGVVLPVSPEEDYFLEVQRGNRTGKSVVHKFGGSASVVATLVPVTISNTYNTPTAPVALEFLSSSANDNSAGSGAREIIVQGIQSAVTWELSTQTFATNGVTPVAIGSWLRIFRWLVSESGTYATPAAGSHAGILTIRVAGGGATWTRIPITPFPVAQSQISVYTIPSGKTGYFRSADVYVDSTKSLNVLCFQRPNADVVTAPYSSMRLVNQWVGLSGEMHYEPDYPNGPYVGPCDFGFMAQGSAVASDITIDFELELIDDA